MRFPVRPYSVTLWFLLPLWVLTLLTLFPPHQFDLTISRLFFIDGTWPWKSHFVLESVLHKAIKWLPVLAILIFSFLTLKGIKNTTSECRTERWWQLGYVLSAVLVSLGLVWWLKQTTGVSCPWSVSDFGGTATQVDPRFSLSFQTGRCWPGGHAGTGFCLLSLYFVYRDKHPLTSKILLGLVLTLGIVCSVARIMQGAHFVSHNVVTFLLDWLVSAALYVLFFDRMGVKKRLVQIFQLSIAQRNFLTALLWTLGYSAPFWGSLIKGTTNEVTMILVTLSMVATLVLVFFLVFLAVLELISLLPFRLQQVLLVLLSLCGALSFVSYELYGTIMTPDMVRNFLETDTAEATQYFSWSSIALGTLLIWPGLFLANITLGQSQNWVDRCKRVGVCAISIFVAGAILLGQLQPFSATMRNNKSLRYLIAPFNVIYSTGSTLLRDRSTSAKEQKIIVDSHPQMLVQQTRPTVFVLVIGETARSDNWQLSGYHRKTNPRLSKEHLINFPRVQACGTSTDVSLPCMLSRVGRRNYDRERILSEEALPALLQRAGYKVTWVDNQSGSKGTSAGVKTVKLTGTQADCPDGRCKDHAFVDDLKNRLLKADIARPQVLIYHMMGSHGPAYNLRSEEQDKVFGEVCTDPSFRTCPPQSIVNAYDASLRYTDRVLADLIEQLRTRTDMDTGLIYVSDHGESLGERGLYLHGAPYYLAPEGQKVVPMLMWLSKRFVKDYSVSESTLLEASQTREITHDNLYHTVLGLLKVKTTAYDSQWDLSRMTN